MMIWLGFNEANYHPLTVALVTEAFIFNFITYNDVAIESTQREAAAL